MSGAYHPFRLVLSAFYNWAPIRRRATDSMDSRVLSKSCFTILGIVSVVAACAGSGARPSAAVQDSSCTTRSASERLPDGHTLIQAYDSLHALARVRPPKGLDLVPFTRKPALINGAQVAHLLQQHYPRALRAAGLGGITMVTMLVHTDGSAHRVQIVRPSHHPELDLATMSVVRGMRFRPAMNGSCPVPSFIVVPVTWKMER